MKQDSANQGLGFLVPVGLSGFAGASKTSASARVATSFRQIQTGRIEGSQRIETGRSLAGDLEGAENMDRAEPGARCDSGVLALGIDADYRAFGHQQCLRPNVPDRPFLCLRDSTLIKV